ncbi:FtsH protease activity modulator HflK [Legionella sp. W05-934-2]|uniref:FtsH protease activity modulator HflK n=1 Tax=Legionella sp. W05-934-2 TaxID=1198649 RepID=UPI0034625C0B
MKQLLNALAKPFIYIYQKACKLFAWIARIWTTVSKYCYDSADYIVRNLIESYGRFLNRFRAYREKHSRSYFLRLFRHFTYIFLTVMILVIILLNYLFIVPVGSSAIITRFGQFNREVESGLNFVFPVIERYYIVNTGNLFEETFGFKQGQPVAKRLQLDPQEQFAAQEYEASVLQAELDANTAFSEKGDFFSEMNRRQRLTHDYIRRNLAPPVEPSNQEIIQRLQQKEQTLEELRAQQISVDGKIPVENEMKFLTGDLNLVLLQWTLQYHISNGSQYLFNSRDVQKNVHDFAQAMMNEVIGELSFNEIVTSGRKEIEKQVLTRTQALIDRLQLGVRIDQVIILNALPPKQVVFAFNEVNKAAQDLERFTYEGEYKYMTRIPKAKGTAKRIISEAEAYATKVVNQAMGQTGRFSLILKEYQVAPTITQDRMYLDSIEQVIKDTPLIILDDKANGIFPLLMPSLGQKQDASPPGRIKGSMQQQLQRILEKAGLQQPLHQATTPAANSGQQPVTKTPSPTNAGQNIHASPPMGR